MQLPSLRMPSLGGDLFEDFPTRRVLLYSAYTIVLFLIFLVLNFPYRVIVKSVLNDVELQNTEIDVHDASLAVWRGLDLRGITVRRADWSRLPVLEIPRAYLWPGFAGLLRGNLSRADLRGELYGGRIKARWSEGEDLQRSIVQIEDLQLARYPPLRELFSEGQVFGLLSGFAEIEARGGDFSEGRANGEIYLDRVGTEELVYGGVQILDVFFEEIKTLFSLQNGRLEIEELVATGPDVSITGSGQIGLRQPLQDSVLDLKVAIEPMPDARDAVKGLVTVIYAQASGRRPGEQLTVSGPLRNPRYR